jgi:hypothetical protein
MPGCENATRFYGISALEKRFFSCEMEAVMVNIDELKSKQTNGCNCDVSTEDIIARLQQWDAKYGIETTDIEFDAVTVRFATVPDDTRPLADEIYEFCPDTVDQHFGCFEEMLEAAEEMGEEIDPAIAELIDGVNFEAEDYGVVLLARSLKRDQIVQLWWD